jgi:hypothetical protein
LQTVVDDYRKVVGRRAVIAHQDKIVHPSSSTAASEVGRFESVQLTGQSGGWRPGGQTFVSLLDGEAAAGTRIRVPIGLVGGGSGRSDFPASAKTGVGFQTRYCVGVQVEALRLSDDWTNPIQT